MYLLVDRNYITLNVTFLLPFNQEQDIFLQQPTLSIDMFNIRIEFMC